MASAEVYIHVTDTIVEAALCYDGGLWQLVRQSMPNPGPNDIGAIYKTKVIKRLSPLHAICDLQGRTGFLEASAKSAPEGAWILAQIRRQAFDGKDPTLTTDIYLRNRYLVCQPNADNIIVPPGMEKSFSASVEALKNMGWNGEVNPQARYADASILLETARLQQKEWLDLQTSYEQQNHAGLLRSGGTDLNRFFQTLDKIDKVYVDQGIYFKELESEFVLMPDLKNKLSMYKGDNIFLEHDILDAWHQACETNIHLPNGVRLRFDITSTLTAIDVDSSGSLMDAAEINRSITAELARLIALKNIGGLIVIDFLKMKQNSDRLMIQQKLESDMALDPLRPRVLGFTKAGLCEITRPRRGQMLSIENNG